MLLPRLITAIVLIPIILTVILAVNIQWFAGFFALLMAVAAWEWAQLAGVAVKGRYAYSVLTLLIAAGLYSANSYPWYYIVVLAGAMYWLFALVVVLAYQLGRDLLPKSSWLLLCMGLLVLIPAWSSLILLKAFFNVTLLVFLLFLIWAADAAAYVIGKRFGTHRLSSRISPGKTWEGSAAGSIAGVLVATIYVFTATMTFAQALSFISIAFIIVLFSILGDLLESLMKRRAAVKDSGRILPGHGGMLDRIDSLTCAAPMFVVSLIQLAPIFVYHELLID